jgi:hypothetical protein
MDCDQIRSMILQASDTEINVSLDLDMDFDETYGATDNTKYNSQEDHTVKSRIMFGSTLHNVGIITIFVPYIVFQLKLFESQNHNHVIKFACAIGLSICVIVLISFLTMLALYWSTSSSTSFSSSILICKITEKYFYYWIQNNVMIMTLVAMIISIFITIMIHDYYLLIIWFLLCVMDHSVRLSRNIYFDRSLIQILFMYVNK